MSDTKKVTRRRLAASGSIGVDWSRFDLDQFGPGSRWNSSMTPMIRRLT